MRRLIRASSLVLTMITCGTPLAAQETADGFVGDALDTIVVYHLNAGGVRSSIRNVTTGSETRVSMEIATERQVAGDPSMIVLPSGVTSWQVLRAIMRIETLSGEATLPSEGSLAPGRYAVKNGEQRWVVIRRMEAIQRQRLNEFWRGRMDDLPYDSKDEALILASLIEEEVSLDEERPMVASVLINRLNQGMRLQLDPTVEYGLTEGEEPLNRGLRQSELRRDTPFNTYVFEGLPPTPISNPSASSIEAALNPADTDYLFYVRDPGGGYAFAATLEKHNENVKRWLRFEAERNSENGD